MEGLVSVILLGAYVIISIWASKRTFRVLSGRAKIFPVLLLIWMIPLLGGCYILFISRKPKRTSAPKKLKSKSAVELRSKGDAPTPKGASTIFISYRRDDQVAAAILVSIYDRLSDRFGPSNVFRDIDSIPLGVDFRRYIAERVAKCDVCITLIGPNWIDILNERRDDPKDFVRVEIESALERGIPLIPILVGDASIPTEDQLPESIRPLAWRNGMSLSMGRDFGSQMERLSRELERVSIAN